MLGIEQRTGVKIPGVVEIMSMSSHACSYGAWFSVIMFSCANPHRVFDKWIFKPLLFLKVSRHRLHVTFSPARRDTRSAVFLCMPVSIPGS